MSLSKANIKYLNSLKLKKFRLQHSKFTAEGDKIVKEVLENPEVGVEKLYCTEAWHEDNQYIIQQKACSFEIITNNELKKISNLQTPNHAFAVVEQLTTEVEPSVVLNELSLALDKIQDPGNFGTILRIADWFGIQYVFCSRDCVDVYNPKVIQATMGAFLRVKVVYTDLVDWMQTGLGQQLNTYGAMLGGRNLFEMSLPSSACIFIGNESKGLSQEIRNEIKHRIAIPANGQADSLNAAVATGIICAAFRNLK